jgi:hypothetical protein
MFAHPFTDGTYLMMTTIVVIVISTFNVNCAIIIIIIIGDGSIAHNFVQTRLLSPNLLKSLLTDLEIKLTLTEVLTRMM